MLSQLPLSKKGPIGQNWDITFSYPLSAHSLNHCGEKWDSLSQFSPIALHALYGVSLICTFSECLDTMVFISQQWYIIIISIQSMVEQLYLLKTENYEKGYKRYHFGQNLIFDSVPTGIKMAIPQKYITLGQTRTAENFNNSRD